MHPVQLYACFQNRLDVFVRQTNSVHGTFQRLTPVCKAVHKEPKEQIRTRACGSGILFVASATLQSALTEDGGWGHQLAELKQKHGVSHNSGWSKFLPHKC